MRVKFLSLLSLLLVASQSFYGQSTFPYDSAWKKIDVLIQKRGLPQSALAAVNKVYAAAKKEKREDQWIKASIYRIQLTEAGEDEPGVRLSAWDSAMAGAPARVRAVLQSAEAAALSSYSQQHAYQRQGQTRVVGDSSTDVSTWPAEKLSVFIRQLYFGSLSEKALLKSTLLNGFDAILVRGNTRTLRPTLYDFLLFRALDYLESPDLFSVSAKGTAIADPRLFAPAKEFREIRWAAPDSTDRQTLAIGLLQEILQFHEPDANPAAYVDADLRRVQFDFLHSTLPEKDSLYLNALARIGNAFPNLPASAETGYLRAAWYARRGAEYDPITDTAHRYDLVTAKAIAEKVASLPDSSEGKSHSQELLFNLLRPVLRIETEKVNLPDLPFRVLLTCRNVKKIYGRIIRIDNPTYESLTQNSYDEANWRRLGRFPAEKKFVFTVPATNDYQEHRVELPVEGLPVGQYALLSSDDSSFSSGSSLAVNYFFQSAIACVNRGSDFYVLNRNLGTPLPGVTVNISHKEYDNNSRRQILVSDGHFETDASGHFRAHFDDTYSYNRVYQFSLGKDRFAFSTGYVYSYQDDNVGPVNQTRAAYEEYWLRNALFADRGIYRPGQTVFVKTLMMTRDFQSRSYRVVAGIGSKLYLLDANEQKADSVSFRSGEFGSFSSSFRLPASGLTGLFRIQDSLTGSETQFSVEEYKRPKFYVRVDTPAGTLRLNDSARFSGTALAYAGSAIDGATVTYRVYRQARYPYPWYFRHVPASQEAELQHGVLKTDEQGQFAISFKAVPDPTVKMSTRPVFTYRLALTVTDANGETREGSGSVAISAQSFEVECPLARESEFPADSLIHFPVTTKNANGTFKPVLLTVSLYALQMPDRPIRSRYWDRPDQFLLNKDAYLKMFPLDEYSDESDKVNWKTTEKLAERTAVTVAGGSFSLLVNNAARLSGWYLITFAGKDVNGDTITDKRWIALGADKSNKPLYPVFSTGESEDQTGEPGSIVKIRTGSSAAPVFVIRAQAPLRDSLTRMSMLSVKNEIKETAIPITEADRGGFVVQDVFVLSNRVYLNTHVIRVPWTSKELAITFETWKDKTLPGAKEIWKLRIAGSRQEKISSEVLTAMYDASLDAFNPGSWTAPDLYPSISVRNPWNAGGFEKQVATEKPAFEKQPTLFYKQYDGLVADGASMSMGGARMNIRGTMSLSAARPAPMDAAEGVAVAKMRKMKTADGEREPDSAAMTRQQTSSPDPSVSIRKNFNETAFFLPDLHTDADGNVSFSFTMPEALTKWRWMVFAHTKDLAFGLDEKSVITQKELMLQPNMPRFLRQGDSLQVPVKISNLSAREMTGKVKIDWRDAADSSERNTAFGNREPEQSFSVPPGQSRTYFFPTLVAKNQSAPVYYRLIATSDGTSQLSDGEEGILPVLSNRRLVTETLPLRLNKENSKNYEWVRLLRSDSSKTLQQHSLTVEYTTRPAWYALQSLPYLMEFPYECAEQTFDRYYANALGSQILSKVPGMTGVMAAWRAGDSTALQSNLQKNEELKNVLLKETPWVLESQSETAQKQRLASLLDSVKLGVEMKKALSKLKALQSDAGGFPWFAGGRDDRYITQYIVTGIGHLLKLKALPASDEADYLAIVKKALGFLDTEIQHDYESRPKKPAISDLDPLQIQYLYMRSFFRDIDLPGKSFFAVNHYRLQAQKYWVGQNMYLRGMIALFLNRNGDKKTAQDIMKSLRENAISSDKDGMYWKRSGSGYYWQESPVETQSLLIEAFAELGHEGETDNLKWWLLQQKQTTHWNSTKSTADACYALLMNGSDWLGTDQSVTIRLGNETVKSLAEKTEAGTGYFKTTIPAGKITAAMGNISVSTETSAGKTVPSFGAVYWQYFEDLDKISEAQTSLSVTKSMFVQRNTDKGVAGEALAPGAMLHVGDKVLLRFIITTDRDLSYVQLKDQRASCFEPADALSGYHWQGNLGFYQAPGDESTSFFFDFLPKGVHVVEYSVYVSANGVFSGGICTLQTMYAPEFAGHSAGLRLQVTEK